jgi:predicted PurR-regulated permease PerM
MDDEWSISRAQIGWGVVGIALGIPLAIVLYSFIGTLVFSIFVYYATRPVYRRLDHRIKHPNLTATITLLIIVLPILLVIGYTLLISIQQLNQILQSANIEQYQSMVQPYLSISGQFSNPRELITSVIKGNPQQLLTLLSKSIGIITTVLLRLFLLFAFTFYLLRDDYKIANWIRESFTDDQEAFGDRRSVIDEFVSGVDGDLLTLYVGNAVLVLVIGAFSIPTYYVLDTIAPPGTGIPYPILLGVLTGIGSLVPVVGMKIVYFPLTAILLGRALITPSPLWFPVIVFLVMFVIVDTIPDFVVRAFVSSRGLHTGLVMFAYILGAVVFGWWGLFFGPLLLILVLRFARIIFPQLVSDDRITA